MINKSGKQLAKEHAETLGAWMLANKDALPTLPSGALNQSAIARAAGLDRQIFTSNPVAQRLLEQYGGVPSGPLRRTDPGAQEESEVRRRQAAEVSRLRDLVAARELELSKLRREVLLLRQHKKMHDMMVDTMQHIKPPPPQPEGTA